MEHTHTYTAFEHHRLFIRGPLKDVVLKIKKQGVAAQILIFSDQTGNTMDFNFQGNDSEVLKRLETFLSPAAEATTGPGRPRLGVTSREVSLLPRHWEWLATQSGGASAKLRVLVEEAMKKSLSGNHIKAAQERTYKFLSVLAGDLPGYEETLRALYRREQKKFVNLMKEWPRDVQKYALELAGPVF